MGKWFIYCFGGGFWLPRLSVDVLLGENTVGEIVARLMNVTYTGGASHPLSYKRFPYSNCGINISSLLR